MEEYYISKEKTEKIKELYEHKQALDDFCLVLCEKKEYIDEWEQMYNKMVSEKAACLNEINLFWEEIRNGNYLKAEDGKQFYLDFTTGRITVQ